jgi:Tol biopolymer transport system component
MKRVLLACLVLAAALPQTAAAQDEDPSRLTLDLYLEFESVSGPQISPDGSQIIYTRRWVDKVNDRRKSALWVMNTDGTRNRFLTDGYGARWSPDGTRIASAAARLNKS